MTEKKIDINYFDSVAAIIDDEVDKLAGLLKASGIVYVKFDNHSIDDFADFAKLFGIDFMSQGVSGIRDPLSNKIVSSVVKSNVGLLLHQERGYSPFHPDLCFFYSINPATRGGATTICDGLELYNTLVARGVDAELLEKKILFSHELDPSTWAERYGDKEDVIKNFSDNSNIKRFEFLDDGYLSYDYTTPICPKGPNGKKVFVNSFLNMWFNMNQPNDERRGTRKNDVTWEDGSLISREFFEQVSEIAEQNTQDLNLVPGDMVILDNYRFMHGRRKFEGDRRVAAIFSKLKPRWT